MPKIVLELTRKEAEELRNAAGNGYGSGDLYESGDFGGSREHAAFRRAMVKLGKALNLVRPESF